MATSSTDTRTSCSSCWKRCAATAGCGGCTNRSSTSSSPSTAAARWTGDFSGGIRALSALKPVVIDESDDALDSFARAAEVGYTGVSAKNCKGLIKAVANRALTLKLGADSGAPFMMTAEDLMNLPVVPLHQDLAQVAALGIGHVERNGHHYVRGLDHLSEAERTGCEEVHAGLYRQEGGMTRLDIRGGRIDLRSLQVPGLGVGVEVDWETMVPLDQWRFDSL